MFQFGEEHPREVGELWKELCSCWPNNLRVIIRYLLIVVGMAPSHLLPHVSSHSSSPIAKELELNKNVSVYIYNYNFHYLNVSICIMVKIEIL